MDKPISDEPTSTSRRDLLRWTAGASAGAAVAPWAAAAPAAGALGAAGAAGPAATRRPISMAMHLHASASEGRGSMAAHLQQATANGVDVVWWTDHDFRHQALGYREEIGFDAKYEPGEPGWEWSYRQEGVAPGAPSTDFVSSPRASDEAGKAMRVAATGERSGWSYVLREAIAYNYTYTRTLADTEIGLDVLLEESGADAVAVIRVQSSYLPATGGRGAGYYKVEYRLGGTEGRWTQDGGRSLVVGLASTPGAWQRLALDPQVDAARAWPDLVSGDLGLDVLQLGVRARRGNRSSVVYDRLRLRRSNTAGNAQLQAQRALMAQYADRYPQVVQHQGTEVSLVRHLNVFGGDLSLPDYGEVSVPSKDASLGATREVVDFAHEHDSLVTLNHPLSDEPSAAALGRMLIRDRALGVDMLEVGVRSKVGQVIKAYDAAARNAVFLTATGTSDDHLGADWRGVAQRWITSVWAGSTSEDDLLGALARGEAWFWDLKRWRGRLDVTAHGSVPMGGVAVTSARTAPIVVTAPALRKNQTLHLVRGVVDLAGPGKPRPRLSRHRLDVKGNRATFTVRTRTSCYVRVEARTRRGGLVAFSNPIWLLKDVPPGGIPAARRHQVG